MLCSNCTDFNTNLVTKTNTMLEGTAKAKKKFVNSLSNTWCSSNFFILILKVSGVVIQLHKLTQHKNIKELNLGLLWDTSIVNNLERHTAKKQEY